MRRLTIYSLLLLVISSILPELSFSKDFLSGKILEVDEKKMELVIEIKNEESTEQSQKIEIHTAEDNTFQKPSGKSVFPGCVVEGDRIRIWGNWKSNKKNVFLAHEIRGCKGGGCSDQTGIISRLKKFSASRGRGIRGNRGGREERKRRYRKRGNRR